MRTPLPEHATPLPAELPRRLLDWYDTVHAKRAMPWRQTRDPYAIWLSETMLQQTQVETVKPYYARFLERFPTIGTLAAAPLEEVLAMWAGLGYYRRAKHLHAAAKKIVAEHDGELPATLEALRELPGIGRYTAGAIGSIAFGLPVAVVDGNVMRVLSRVFGYARDIAAPAHQEFFWREAGVLVAAAPGGRYGDFNQAMMELGATVCTPPPAAPACLLCPLKGMCRAFAEGRQAELPVKSAKKQPKILRGRALVILREAGSGANRLEVLLMRRPQGGIWEGMWEFPLVTEEGVVERMGLGGLKRCGTVRHTLTHRSIRLTVFTARNAPKRWPGELPMCFGAKDRYEEARWHSWPLVATELPMSRLVRKVAAIAEGRRQ